MASKYFCLFLILFVSKVESASLLEKSYDYFVNLGKSIAPSFITMLDCFGEEDFWSCAKEKAGKFLDNWDQANEQQRRLWQEAADSEVSSSGRAIKELPSQLSMEVEESLLSFADIVQNGMARAFSRGHHEDGGEATITISTSGSDKKKSKKKKKKPAKIQLVHPMMVKTEETDRGFGNIQSWVIGGKANDNSRLNDNISSLNDNISSVKDDDSSMNDDVSSLNNKVSSLKVGVRKGRGFMADLWSVGEKTVDALAEHAVESDNADNGVEDKSSFEEQRGKKKKKKKAILKLLILGAVLKAKIATLLQILSFKLQVKFFIIALVGLGINLARFWLDLKKQHAPPQKVIYYEHAQHQHHYDHEHEDDHGWGPWSRSADPEETDDGEIDVATYPYRAQIDRNIQQLPYHILQNRPALSRVPQ